MGARLLYEDDTIQHAGVVIGFGGIAGHCFNEILLRDSKGRLLPRVDGAIPYDVTHPLWKEYTRRKFNDFVKWDFDYVKVDFMSHGGMEGVHYDSSVRTGRQALNAAYQFIDELLKPEKQGNLSLSAFRLLLFSQMVTVMQEDFPVTHLEQRRM